MRVSIIFSYFITDLFKIFKAQTKPVSLSITNFTLPYFPLPIIFIWRKSYILNYLGFLFFSIIFFKNVGVIEELTLWGKVLLDTWTILVSLSSYVFSVSQNDFWTLFIQLLSDNNNGLKLSVSVLDFTIVLLKHISEVFL